MITHDTRYTNALLIDLNYNATLTTARIPNPNASGTVWYVTG